MFSRVYGPITNCQKKAFQRLYFLKYMCSLFTSAEDIENLITKEIEKEVKAINGIKKITSNSVQNTSSVIIEFDTDIDVTEAKRDVQDAVNRAVPELPEDLLKNPEVYEIDISKLHYEY